jgi:hypothetical protein
MAFYTQIHTSKKFRLGTEKKDYAGNTYVYAKGVGSTAVGSWVSFDEVFVTALLVANAVGRVGISQSANTSATNYSWYLIDGTGSGLCLASYADNAKVWCTSTPGSVDDADVAVDLVDGAIGRSARDTTTGLATFQLMRPFCLNEVKN